MFFFYIFLFRQLASASDDYNVIVWDPFRHKKLATLETPHQGNIFSVKVSVTSPTPHTIFCRINIFCFFLFPSNFQFLPKSGDALVATGAGDAKIFVFDLNRNDPSPTWRCQCHKIRVKRLATAPETPFIFWSAAEDGFVLQFDMRQPHTCQSNDKVVLVNFNNHAGLYGEVKCIAVNPRRPELLAIGANDSFVRLYDRRMISLDRMPALPTADDNQGCSYTNTNDNLPRGCVTYFCPGHLNDPREKVGYSRATTYVSFSPDGTERNKLFQRSNIIIRIPKYLEVIEIFLLFLVLENMGSEQIYLYDINNVKEPEFLNLPRIAKRQSSICSDTEEDEDDNATDESYGQPLRVIPQTVELEKKLGNDYLEEKNYLQAIYQYTLAIKKEPSCPVLYLNRATALMKRGWCGDVYAALRDCHEALRLDVTYVKAHFRLTRALLELNHIQEAVKSLEELKSRFPTYASNYGVMMLQKDIDLACGRAPNVALTWYHGLEMSENEKYWRSGAKDYKERFVGHCNTTTDIKEANFFGNDSNYVIAG